MDKTEAVLTVRYTDFSGNKLQIDVHFLFHGCIFTQKLCTTLKKKAGALIFVHVKLGQVRYLLGKRVLIYQLFFHYVPVFYTQSGMFLCTLSKTALVCFI
jgi:hypothetical protein